MKLPINRILLLLISVSFSSCGENNAKETTAAKSSTKSYAAKPSDPHLSNLKLEEQLSNEIREAMTAASDTLVAEAATVVAETRNAVGYLLNNNTAAATKSIETAIGKAEVVTTAKPSLRLVPLEVNMTIHDLVADMDVLKKIRDDAEDLTDKGYLQDVRRLLEGLSCELSLRTSSLPLGTYPLALKEAGRLTKENHPLSAAIMLSTALNTIVSEGRSIPLPLIRAEVMLKEVDSLLGAGSANEEQINLYLDNADYQIRFAEALGYGKKDKEFEEFYDAIKSLKKEVKEKSSTSRKSNNDLRNKLNLFKKRISPKTEVKG
jgi:hypothetical protein